DVVTGHTTGVEGTHRQLRTRLTDGLRGDDTHGLADVDRLAGRQRAAVAGAADAQLRLAGQHRTDPDVLGTGRDDPVDLDRVQVGTARYHHAGGVGHVVGQGTGVHTGLGVLVQRQRAVDEGADLHADTPLGTAVLLADD